MNLLLGPFLCRRPYWWSPRPAGEGEGKQRPKCFHGSRNIKMAAIDSPVFDYVLFYFLLNSIHGGQGPEWLPRYPNPCTNWHLESLSCYTLKLNTSIARWPTYRRTKKHLVSNIGWNWLYLVTLFQIAIKGLYCLNGFLIGKPHEKAAQILNCMYPKCPPWPCHFVHLNVRLRVSRTLNSVKCCREIMLHNMIGCNLCVWTNYSFNDIGQHFAV